MKKTLSQSIKFLFFLSISAFLFWLIYRGQNTSEILKVLKNDVNYFWIFISLTFGLLSHVSRTIRWNMLIESLGKKPRFINTFLAVMVGYFANLALPRMGEISRCGVISKYEDVSFSKLIGTVVLERALDILMLLLFLLIALVTQFDVLSDFITRNPEVSSGLSTVFASSTTMYVLAGIVLLLFIFVKKFKHTAFYKKITFVLANFMDGFRAIRKLDNKLLFVFHTVFIWVMYYMMTYICFFSFGFTSNLPALAGLTVFVMGSFGMVAPVQGGIGAWHFMVIATLLIYLPDTPNIEKLSRSFALVVHGSQTAMIIILGALSVIILPFVNRKNIIK
ncbi:lysylphosphatidylglycerol synthase transmembrane domain-containing protein [Ancylomarina sp. 16SWW S1-10-2]|uniref:lysylphosphatidylglycerol synthase transmembrane domain-containing protein n=1 Tax=Ancylomarina sp. 16SWW S1-10-2 TaxID=2499681 RepID=UPI0012ADDC9F|nr:lysylphosphatidylglycerol synthase transmembrane domain-containing protein [Ancylomarina sp. 16SWW S1-10-2]MRT91676.1 flippase-like domain-containing protein [Ancylomarina sp. 16SWW S1-10-2]